MPTCPTCRTRYDEGVVACTKDGARLLPDEAFTGADVDLQPGLQVGEYRIEVKLGEGGFGTVYRARHPVIGKTAAIKVLAREFSAKPEIVARFIDEARAANQIRHKGIVDIFSFGSLPDGRHYFVMELLEGAPLDAYLKQRVRIPPGETIAILRSVARAVDAAHQAGIAHRDLKPDNVFLLNDEDGVARTKLLDFGIAKLLGEQSGRTRTGTPIGTPQYMSPEQARGHQVDTRTDVYSFGAMAFEMLTGRVPFEGATIMDILLKQISEQPPAPSSVCADLPSALDAPILHMMDKDPAKRPATLGAAVEELAAAAASVGIAAGPTSTAVAPAASQPDVMARTVPATPPVPSGPSLPSGKSLIGSATEVPEPKTHRGAYFVALALLAAAGVAGALFFAWHHGAHATVNAAAAPSHETAPPASTSPTMAPSALAASAAPEDAHVAITIDATPKNAQIYEGERLLGTAPGPFSFPKRAGTAKLTVRAPGYEPRALDVATSADATLPIALTRVTKAQPAASRSISTDLDNGYR